MLPPMKDRGSPPIATAMVHGGRRCGILLLLAVLVVVNRVAAAPPVTSSWLSNAATTDWNTAGNWDNGIPDAAIDTGRKNLLTLALAAAVSVTPSLQLMTEVVGSSNTDSASSVWPVFMTGGASYAITDSLDVDLGVRAGLTNTAADISLLTGCTVRF